MSSIRLKHFLRLTAFNSKIDVDSLFATDVFFSAYEGWDAGVRIFLVGR